MTTARADQVTIEFLDAFADASRGQELVLQADSYPQRDLRRWLHGLFEFRARHPARNG
jgi:hypothetical protein